MPTLSAAMIWLTPLNTPTTDKGSMPPMTASPHPVVSLSGGKDARAGVVPPMRFAYADPPYLGCGALYDDHHADARDWDDPETHRALITRLCDDYPDGWAMSLSSPSLRTILPMCPTDCRIGAWVKPFAIFKPNVNPAYAWEPVIFRGGRSFTRKDETVRDWVSAVITLRRGLTGAKPRAFCRWVFGLLNAHQGDVLDDLFPGTGAVCVAWAEWSGEPGDFTDLFVMERAPIPSAPGARR